MCVFVTSRSIVICHLLQGVRRLISRIHFASEVCLVFEFGVKVETMQICYSFEFLFSLNEENIHLDAINLINTREVPGRRRNHNSAVAVGPT